MSTNNHIDLIEFPADSPEQVQASSEFFNAVFGWEFKTYGSEYSDTQSSSVTAGINGTNTKEQTAPLAVIYVTDLKATKDAIIKAGGTITHDIMPFPGGKRFAFTEPSGNQLAVWSEE